MKKLTFMSANACIFAVSGCQNKGTVTETSMPIENQNEKIWSEKDIDTMFSQVKESDWGYVGCVLVSDYASDRAGAVLFGIIRKKRAMLLSLMRWIFSTVWSICGNVY